MGHCPPLQPRCLRQSHTPAPTSHSPRKEEGWREGIRGQENWLPLEDKAVVPWSLGPALKPLILWLQRIMSALDLSLHI